jgi:phosphatidylserine decarboxylase
MRAEARGIPLRARLAAAVIDASPDWSASAISRVLGAAARTRIPRGVSRAAVTAYARVFGVDLTEVDPLALEEGFGSFDEFFTRSLRSGVRVVDRTPTVAVAPCDGHLREIVPLAAGSAVVAKGHAYSLEELLCDAALASRFEGGWLASIYLHPRDYHRVHAPCDALVTRVTLVPGRLLPVTDAALRREPALFARNERLVHVMETVHGVVAVVMVAAFGVGHMSCAYRKLPAHPRELQVQQLDPPARLRKGDELGVFHLGSTVLLLCEAGVRAVAPPGRIRLGAAVFQGAT